MTVLKTKVSALTLSVSIITQSNAVLDAGNLFDTERARLYTSFKKAKYRPSQFKGIESEGGQGLVLTVLLPRFIAESGKELVAEVMNPKYKATHVVKRSKLTVDGGDDVPALSKSIKQWKNTALSVPLKRLGDGYAAWLGEQPQPLHESPQGKLVPIPTGNNHPTGPRNTVPKVVHTEARIWSKFAIDRKRVLELKVAADKADTTDRMMLKRADEVLHELRGHLPKNAKAKK